MNPLTDAYIRRLRLKNRHPETLRQYAHALKNFFAFTDTPLCRLTRIDLEQWQRHLSDRGFAAATREEMGRKIILFFNWLEEAGHIFASPARGLSLPKREHKIGPTPTEEEVQRLLARPDPLTPVGIRDRAILETAYGCGPRRSELAAMSIHDPDLKNGALRIFGKGRKQRLVPVGRQAVRRLRRYLTHARPRLLKGMSGETGLWISIQRKAMTGQALHDLVRRHAGRAGIETPVTLHGLRRACVSHMLRNGARPVDIQLMLGHANLKHLHHYLAVIPEDLRTTHQQSRPGR